MEEITAGKKEGRTEVRITYHFDPLAEAQDGEYAFLSSVQKLLEKLAPKWIHPMRGGSLPREVVPSYTKHSGMKRSASKEKCLGGDTLLARERSLTRTRAKQQP